MAGDAIQNLRSALDIMVCDLIRANNATPTHNSGFPSSNEPSKARPKIQGASAATEKFVLRLKGTKRWNDPLRLLQRLDNLHKHNRLMAVGAASVGVLARVHMPGISMTPEGGIMFFGGPGGTPCMQQPGIPTHSGQVFLREGDNELYRLVPHFDEDVRADIGVVFGAGEIGAGQGVRETIFQLANLVERILIVCERRVI